jgi:hypothetical protein
LLPPISVPSGVSQHIHSISNWECKLQNDSIVVFNNAGLELLLKKQVITGKSYAGLKFIRKN